MMITFIANAVKDSRQENTNLFPGLGGEGFRRRSSVGRRPRTGPDERMVRDLRFNDRQSSLLRRVLRRQAFLPVKHRIDRKGLAAHALETTDAAEIAPPPFR